MNRQKLREQVESLLRKHPGYRSDSQRLISSIWLIESAELGCNSVYEFLSNFGDKNLTPLSLIKLTKRQLQTKYPELN